MNKNHIAIPLGDLRYPEGLKSVLAGTTLYANGNVDLLGQSGIGICGSRDASPEALEWAFHRRGYRKGGTDAGRSYLKESAA